MDVIASADGAGRPAVLRSLVARAPSGVQPVIADAHAGLRAAIEESVPTGASWQRCRTHAVRNLLTRVPKPSRSTAAPWVRTIFEQADSERVWAQHARVVEQPQGRFRDAAHLLVAIAPDPLAFTPCPVEHRSAIGSNTP